MLTGIHLVLHLMQGIPVLAEQAKHMGADKVLLHRLAPALGQ
jgi:hypothetical protein